MKSNLMLSVFITYLYIHFRMYTLPKFNTLYNISTIMYTAWYQKIFHEFEGKF